jgi:putative sigma-54 modulation protein
MEYFAKEDILKFTPVMKEFLEEKIQRLSKYLKDLDGRVVLKREGKGPLLKLEITLPGGIRSSATHEDFYQLVLIVIDQLERQLNKYKGVRKHNKTKKITENFVEFDEAIVEEEMFDIRHKVIPSQTMSDQEAIEKMELLGHTFFIFTDRFTGRTHVAYKRYDGGYGILIVMQD